MTAETMYGVQNSQLLHRNAGKNVGCMHRAMHSNCHSNPLIIQNIRTALSQAPDSFLERASCMMSPSDGVRGLVYHGCSDCLCIADGPVTMSHRGLLCRRSVSRNMMVRILWIWKESYIFIHHMWDNIMFSMSSNQHQGSHQYMALALDRTRMIPSTTVQL